MNYTNLHIELGHTYEGWIELARDNADLWDFSLDDVLSGAVELQEDVIYWLVKDEDGEYRLCEANLTNEQKFVKYLNNQADICYSKDMNECLDMAEAYQEANGRVFDYERAKHDIRHDRGYYILCDQSDYYIDE